MTITPGQGSRRAAEGDIEQASDTPKLSLLKDAVMSVADAASNYYNRTQISRDWLRAIWEGQTTDARRWATNQDDKDEIWPWPGASDTRVRLCEKLVREHSTVGRFALMNAKRQAKSVRPLATMRESQVATQLLNWMLDTHCWQQNYREQELMLAWRHGFGCAVTAVDWEQQRRVDYIEFNMTGLAEFVRRVGQNMMSNQSAAGDAGPYSRNGAQNDQQLALGFMQALAQTRDPLGQLQAMIMDPAYEEDLVRVLQSTSPILTKRGAAKSIRDLRELRFTTIPVPYVFTSRPRRTTLRPMVDVFFPELTGDLQRAPFVDWVEYVRPNELEDRVDTMNYDPGFVDQAKAIRGPSRTGGFGDRYAGIRDGLPTIVGPGGSNHASANRPSGSDWLDDIELHHIYAMASDKGVPVLYCTTFHMDLDVAAYHAPIEYAHGQMIFHGHRFETEERPLLSSRGIPEIAYTWEMEVKKQRDGRADRVDMVLRPPIFTTAYEEIQKFKAAYMPGSWVPIRRFDSIEKDKPPMWDPGSIEIDKTLLQTVDEFFWGGADSQIRQLRHQELADAILAEEKPIVMQQWQLIQQFLPDATVARVVGPLQRPFHVEHDDIQGQFDMTMTVDMRELDPDFLKQKLGYIVQLATLDTMGVLDRAKLVRLGAESIDVTLADEAVRDTEPATQAEIQDEQKTFALIVGSGRPQPLPQGGNYQLRLQTLQTELQTAMQTDPDFPRRVQQFPGIMQVLQQRIQFFQRQLQQQQNAQIGRIQVADPFTKQAPQLQDMGAGGAA